MPQFAVYRNKNAKTKNTIPYLLDVQSDLLNDLQTRVVVPLHSAKHWDYKLMSTLTPVFNIDGKSCVMLTPQLAGIAKRELGTAVADFCEHRAEIMAALDFLITGI